VPLTRGNIGHWRVIFDKSVSNLALFGAAIENPRVGGSIPRERDRPSCSSLNVEKMGS
jgi:hypothetical protein